MATTQQRVHFSMRPTYDDATRVCHRYIEAARAIADARRCRGAYLRILLSSALYMYRIEVVAWWCWRRRRIGGRGGGGWEFESTGGVGIEQQHGGSGAASAAAVATLNDGSRSLRNKSDGQRYQKACAKSATMQLKLVPQHGGGARPSELSVGRLFSKDFQSTTMFCLYRCVS